METSIFEQFYSLVRSRQKLRLLISVPNVKFENIPTLSKVDDQMNSVTIKYGILNYMTLKESTFFSKKILKSLIHIPKNFLFIFELLNFKHENLDFQEMEKRLNSKTYLWN